LVSYFIGGHIREGRKLVKQSLVFLWLIIFTLFPFFFFKINLLFLMSCWKLWCALLLVTLQQ
jgi:hypothetical protein